jgi:hypothetical protein
MLDRLEGVMKMETPRTSYEFYKGRINRINETIADAEEEIKNIYKSSQCLYMEEVFHGGGHLDELLAMNKRFVKEKQQIIQNKKQELADLKKRFQDYRDEDFRKIDEAWLVILEEMKK